MREEYNIWVKSYSRYLSDLYNGIFVKYLTRKEKKEISFDKFCLFVYNSSSGVIIDYL